VGEGALKGGLRCVVALGDLGAVSVLLHELLLGQEVVGEETVEGPEFVEDRQLGVSVKAQVAHELAHVGPVLLLHVGPVVLVARTRPREGDPSL
jgi:hypothetical protein